MGIIDYLKDAAKLAQELNRMDLYQHLLSAQEDVLELRTELLHLKEENSQLSSKLRTIELLVFDKGVYWIKKDPMTTNGDDTPVCPTCYDTTGIIIRGTIERYAEGLGLYCKKCKMVHRAKEDGNLR